MPIGTNTFVLAPIGKNKPLVLYIAKIFIHKTHLPYKITLCFSVYKPYQFVDNYSLYTPLSTFMRKWKVIHSACI